MLMQAPHPYALTIDHCPCEANRFRWEIRRGPRLVRSSMKSSPTEHDAVVDGYAALRGIIADWRAARAD